MATSVYTIKDFIQECSSFQYSDEYFGLLKESAEIMLIEKYIEAKEYIHENSLKSSEYMHFTEATSDPTFSSASKSKSDKTSSEWDEWSEDIKSVADGKKKGLIQRIIDGLFRILEMAKKAFTKFIEKIKSFGKNKALQHENVEKALSNPEAVKEMLKLIDEDFYNGSFEGLNKIKAKSTYTVPTGDGVSEKDALKLGLILTLLTEDAIEIDPRSFNKYLCDAEEYSEAVDQMYDFLSEAREGEHGKIDQIFADILKRKTSKFNINDKALQKAIKSMDAMLKINRATVQAAGVDPEDLASMNEITGNTVKLYSDILNFRTEYRPKFSAIVEKYI